METLGPILQMVQFQRFYKCLEVARSNGMLNSNLERAIISGKDQVF